MEGQTGMSVLFFYFLNPSESGMSVEVGAELSQGFGHIFTPKAKTDVARLIVDGAREQQDAGVTDDFFAEGEHITLRFKPRETDGAGVGFHPLEPMRALLDKGIEKAQIAQDDLQIALHKDFTMAESQGGEKLARDAAADGGVVLEFQAAPDDFRIAAGEPSETQSGEAVRLAHGAEADAMFISFAGSGQARGGVVFEFAVDLIVKEDDVAAGGECQRSEERRVGKECRS